MMATDDMITMTPPGYRFDLLWAAYLKWALQTEENPRERLLMLEGLELCAHGEMPEAAIKAIEPMPPLGIKVMHEAFSLGTGVDRFKGGRASFNVMTDGGVFRKLIAINPSIGEAVAIYQRRHDRAPTQPFGSNQHEHSNQG